MADFTVEQIEFAVAATIARLPDPDIDPHLRVLVQVAEHWLSILRGLEGDWVRGRVDVYACGTCGALVARAALHDEWHEEETDADQTR